MKLKIISLLILLMFLFQFCKKENKPILLKDFEIKSYSSIIIKDSNLMRFVDDYVNLPENIHRKVFTLYFDQRNDTLAFTIWRCLRRYVSLENSIGYFKINGKVVLLYSPFTSFLHFPIDKKTEKEINNLYKDELEYYKNHRHELVMWQLRYSYFDENYRIIRNYNRIVHTLKPPIPDSIKVDIQWPAD